MGASQPVFVQNLPAGLLLVPEVAPLGKRDREETIPSLSSFFSHGFMVRTLPENRSVV